jgi:hypothetical protein
VVYWTVLQEKMITVVGKTGYRLRDLHINAASVHGELKWLKAGQLVS